MAKTTFRYSWVGATLAALNFIGCMGFVFSRPPLDEDYLRRIDDVKARGGITYNSAIAGIVACRALIPWGEWHGKELWYVKVIQVANIDIVFPLVILYAMVSVVVFIPTCIQSWVFGILFLLLSIAQWYFFGLLLQRLFAKRR